jgi:ectoine hydroxylase-related dioxygenase (phytanoyl-CoA dioxygenase family)
MNISKENEKTASEINAVGYSIIENVLSPDFIQRCKAELEKAIEAEAKWHGTKDYQDYGMVLLCSLYGGTFLELLENEKVLAPFEAILGPGCIVYAYTSSSMPPTLGNYSCRIHVDSPRFIPGYVTNMGATILLDDFTEENGATYYLPSSHTMEKLPSEDYFFKNAKRLVAKAGTGFFFNARTVHAGGQNKTNKWRHALTFNICRPYMHQRIDIPRAMAKMDLSGVSDRVKQKLGFFTQVPTSYEEYYAPIEKRKYKQQYE